MFLELDAVTLMRRSMLAAAKPFDNLAGQQFKPFDPVALACGK
jgi:hypothetical protein